MAGVSDLCSIVKVHWQSLHQGFTTGYLPEFELFQPSPTADIPNPALLDHYRQSLLENTDHHIIKMTNNEAVCGGIQLSHIPDHGLCHISSLFIANEHQGAGLALLITRFALDFITKEYPDSTTITFDRYKKSNTYGSLMYNQSSLINRLDSKSTMINEFKKQGEHIFRYYFDIVILRDLIINAMESKRR
ncbi:GNAT family N-acetyltransferase [Candidatus Dojkabacteria bacterium]|uniref:GNAT family N-acetyltransferase n=1 Tax=Candidatus Dojkabacteria bacterium TaxID=2099670 RepID=A0A955RKJ2_9BACT|nr:GNAT family N-acetyltransferase [Candidatus Dojkabacteria bacterium]